MEEDNAGTQGIATRCSLHLAGEMLNLALFSLQPLGYAIPPQNVSLLPKLLEPKPQVFSRDGGPLWKKPTLSCVRELFLCMCLLLTICTSFTEQEACSLQVSRVVPHHLGCIKPKKGNQTVR